MLFYLLDVVEARDKRSLYLFGKLEDGKRHCHQVKNLMHHLYFVVRRNFTHKQVCAEVRRLLGKRGIKNVRTKNMTKTYCFAENPNIPRGECAVVCVEYPVIHSALPASLTGETFSTFLGRNNSLTENFLITRKIHGPGWLEIDERVKPVESEADMAPPCLTSVAVHFSSPEKIQVVAGDEAMIEIPQHQLHKFIKEHDPDVIFTHDFSLKSYRGRIFCDTYIMAKELVKSSTYSLKDLRGQDYVDGQEAAEILKLAKQLEIISLTLKLTQIAGNLWNRTLAGVRWERVEYFLLHAFYERGYLLPDRVISREKNNIESIKGGHVIDPVRGLYRNCVVLLDYNSLYPSIIREYNLCFSTWPRCENEAATGVLPEILGYILEQRRKIRHDPQQKVAQLALKLSANMVYGYIAGDFRLSSKEIAALVTRRGREALHLLQDIVKKDFPQLQVIYGDTDSIMIDTQTANVEMAKKWAEKVRANVNNRFKVLRLGLDAVFTSTLLVKKKKYAAEMVYPQVKREIKGLEQVRRDWCDLAKETADQVLDLELGGLTGTRLMGQVQELLVTLKDNITTISRDKFVIRVMLSKDPSKYKEGGGNVHVAIARQQQKKKGDIVEYLMCGENAVAMPATTDEPLATVWYWKHQILPAVSRLFVNTDNATVNDLCQMLGLATATTRPQAREFHFYFKCTKCLSRHRFKAEDLFCSVCGFNYDIDACGQQLSEFLSKQDQDSSYGSTLKLYRALTNIGLKNIVLPYLAKHPLHNFYL